MFKRAVLSLAPVVVICGCAVSSVFVPYSFEAARYKNALISGNPEPVMAALNSKVQAADRLLYLSERGRINQVNGRFEDSKADFERAIALYSERDDKARISASGLVADSASLMTNDNAIPYRGQDFERIFLYQFQAFNYLAQQNLTGASVELRRAALEQRTLELKNEKAIAAAEEKARESNIQLPDASNFKPLQEMNTLVANVKSGFQNAYTFYTSAVVWEAMGARNDALVDYKKALQINPDSRMLRADVERLDKGLGSNPDPTHATLIVLLEDGFIPARQSFVINVPDFHRDKIYSIAFPYYSSVSWYRPLPMSVAIDHRVEGRTEVIADFGAMAVKSLKDRIPELLVRQILRARVKYEMQNRAQKNDPLVGLAATLYNIASEQADLRNWLTLPNNAQGLRLQASGGEHNVQLSTAAANLEIPVTLVDGRTTILRVFNFNHRLQTQIFQL